MSRAADALEGLGLLDKVYQRHSAFLDAWEVALPRVPSPSPFELGAGELSEPSAFLTGGSPFIPAVAPIAAVAPVARVPAVRARNKGGDQYQYDTCMIVRLHHDEFTANRLRSARLAD